MLDIDGALKFLALDSALVNNDGYWTRASDYSIYQDPKGMFHIFPHDANETFGPGGGGRGWSGRPGGPGGPPRRTVRTAAAAAASGMRRRRPAAAAAAAMMMGGAELDPLVGLNDATKPLRSKLLAVPALRARYMTYVQADRDEVARLEHARPARAEVPGAHRRRREDGHAQAGFVRGVLRPAWTTLKTFAERRRAFLLK